MRSKDITIGMKVVAVSKSAGQSWKSWKELIETSARIYGRAADEVLTVMAWDRHTRSWVCRFSNRPGTGYFLAKDLVEWRPE